MSGALVELVAKGVQDVHLTGQPEVSFFRQTFKRHTNFAMTTVRLNPIGGGSEHVIKLVNKGDLLGYVWVDLGATATLAGAAVAANTASPASFELWIGGQMIERQDAFYMVQLWQKFLVDSGAKAMAMVADDDDATILASLLASKWLPLHFFFCDSYYLPLLALQYAEVEIRIQYAATTNVSDFKYYANYVVLDTDERAAFVDQDLDILIEQVQKITAEGSAAAPRFDLNLLNHPVKCLLWGEPDGTQFVTDDVQIYLNGTELFESKLPDKFFTQVQGYYHSEFGSELLKGGSGVVGGGGALKMYSFALKANRHQPCGTCNFSRLDNASLTIGSVTGGLPTTFNLYAVNYNILRIKKGLAGVAYSN
jgi:hypothetical protein